MGRGRVCVWERDMCQECINQDATGADSTLALAHLYDNTFPSEGVWVTGAGSARVNGWYRRRELDNSSNSTYSYDWHWYQKPEDDNCFIIRHAERWLCRTRRPTLAYSRMCPTRGAFGRKNIPPPLPPAEGWTTDRNAEAPAPTLQVVSWSR